MTTEPKPTVAAVLLAAGESTRMGESKALLPWTGGEPLVAYHVRALHEAGYAPIVVVVGHDAERVVEALPDDVEVLALYNSRYRQGRTSSIVTGVLELADPSTDGLLLISVDQPRSVTMLRQLREAWETERPFLAIPSLDHKAGHPPLFDGGMIPELLQVTEEQEGLRQVMQDFADQRFFVNVDDPLTLTNLNTREEYEAALKIAAG
jgi:CTP:molybdopterin cytidylyltransferase MocA